MIEINIARVQFEDIGDLKEIEIECRLSPWTIDAYENELGRPDSVMLKATRADGKISGFIVGRSPLEPGEAEIYNLGVKSRFRRQGIAAMLLEEFFNICENRASPTVWLEVRAANTSAIEFYLTKGFVQKGVRPRFYNDPPDDALLLSASVNRGRQSK